MNNAHKGGNIQKFLIENAYDIQKRATQQHQALLGPLKLRNEFMIEYQQSHVEIVQKISAHLNEEINTSLPIFKKIGKELGAKSVKDGLTIQEAVDGIIFLKQATWQLIDEANLIPTLSVQDFFRISQVIGTYSDVVCSSITFVYHEHTLSREEKTKQKIEEMSRNKDEFVAAATHELRTPITTIKGYVQVLQERFSKLGDAKTAAHLTKINAQIDRLNTLIGDLLDVTKIKSGKLEFHLDSYNFDELVKEVVDALQFTTDKHTLVTELSSFKTLFGDRERILQVISNILANAIKYSPAGGEILIKSSADNQAVHLSIQDSGVGIPEDKKGKVFERFYRVEGSKESTFPGLGLGLYISSEIIQRHGGTIGVESIWGKGSTFYVSLPLHNSQLVNQKNNLVEVEITHE